MLQGQILAAIDLPCATTSLEINQKPMTPGLSHPARPQTVCRTSPIIHHGKREFMEQLCTADRNGRCGGRYAIRSRHTSLLLLSAPHGSASDRRSEPGGPVGTRLPPRCRTWDTPQGSTRPDEYTPAAVRKSSPNTFPASPWARIEQALRVMVIDGAIIPIRRYTVGGRNNWGGEETLLFANVFLP